MEFNSKSIKFQQKHKLLWLLRCPSDRARSGESEQKDNAMAMDPEKAWETAMRGYGAAIKGIVASHENAEILELGAGRWASFTREEMPSTVRSYTVNDISENELALLPKEYQKACFDVSGDASNFSNTYDVVFSRFLAEHVPDGPAMHRNVYQVLREGGTAFHLIPTLYAFPFLVNKYMPESLGKLALKMISPRRSISPKFPAPYSACYSNRNRMTRMLEEIGYRNVEIRTFYGHFYYEKVPILKHIHEKYSELASKRDWYLLGTYAYIKAQK